MTRAQEKAGGVLGDWNDPGGSAIRVSRCGQDVCLNLIKINSKEGYKVDGENPDPAKKTRPLCNLELGSGFQLLDPNHAEGGHIYDPKSGKTYQATMTAEGDTLNLRGYVLIKAFGRTERWTRVQGGVKDSCS